MTDSEPAPQRQQNLPSIIDDVIARGDLRGLTPEQRVVHYRNVCGSLGLNYLTGPFMYVTLNGKLVLYPKKDCTDQLRKINGINISIESTSVHEGLLTVRVRASDKAGRVDEDFGVVSIGNLKGDVAANAFMKAVTKAKRRVTLSISGLGFAEDGNDDDAPFTHLTAADVPNRISPSLSQDERSTIAEQQASSANAELTQATGQEAQPFVIERNGDDVAAWSAWATTLLAYIRAASTVERVNDWTSVNSDNLAALSNFDAGKYRRLVDMVEHQVAIRSEQGQQ